MPHPFWEALIQTRQGLAISAQRRIPLTDDLCSRPPHPVS